MSRADEPRLLASRSELGYVNNSAQAMRGEAEAVDEETQRALTSQAHRRWQHEQQRAWGRARTSIFGAIEGFRRDGHPDRGLAGDLRVIERQVAKVDRRVGL